MGASQTQPHRHLRFGRLHPAHTLDLDDKEGTKPFSEARDRLNRILNCIARYSTEAVLTEPGLYFRHRRPTAGQDRRALAQAWGAGSDVESPGVCPAHAPTGGSKLTSPYKRERLGGRRNPKKV